MSRMFRQGGKVSQQINGYKEREGQIAMAEDMENFLDDEFEKVYIGEGPVGTGKTLAYLLSSLYDSKEKKLRGGTTIVSTGSITLQDQLVNKDLKDVNEILDGQISYASLKGLNNYLCMEQLEDYQDNEKDPHPDLSIIEDLVADSSYKGGKPDQIDYRLWNKLTTTSTLCSKEKCPFADDCYYMKQRMKATGANVLVVNHHLLAADIYIRKISEGNAAVLPSADTYIIDEAHDFEDAVVSFFTKTLSGMVIKRLASRLTNSLNKIDFGKYENAAYLGEKYDELLSKVKLMNLENLEQFVEDIARRNAGDLITKPIECEEWIDKLREIKVGANIKGEIKGEAEREVPVQVETFIKELNDVIERFEWLNDHPESIAMWSEERKGKYSIKMADIDVSTFLQEFWHGDSKFILTSATLTVDGDFEYIKGVLGIDDAVTGSYPSPFDYLNQANFIVPRAFNPKKDSFNDNVLEAICKLVENGHDKTLVLFTSYRQMNELMPKIRLKYNRSHVVLEQNNNMSKAFLLDRFQNAEKSILIAQAASFGTGVDIKGNKNIILVKLNFDNPSDPLVKAKTKAIEADGGNSFMDFSIPRVVIRTKQQLGRGIRSEDDKANIAILDGRLVRTYWGRKIINSLPKMKLYKSI